jgi:anti-repressor protein
MSVTTVTDMPNGGTKPIKDYLLTIDMAKELCMRSKTGKAKKAC